MKIGDLVEILKTDAGSPFKVGDYVFIIGRKVYVTSTWDWAVANISLENYRSNGFKVYYDTWFFRESELRLVLERETAEFLSI